MTVARGIMAAVKAKTDKRENLQIYPELIQIVATSEMLSSSIFMPARIRLMLR